MSVLYQYQQIGFKAIVILVSSQISFAGETSNINRDSY